MQQPQLLQKGHETPDMHVSHAQLLRTESKSSNCAFQRVRDPQVSQSNLHTDADADTRAALHHTRITHAPHACGHTAPASSNCGVKVDITNECTAAFRRASTVHIRTATFSCVSAVCIQAPSKFFPAQ